VKIGLTFTIRALDLIDTDDSIFAMMHARKIVETINAGREFVVVHIGTAELSDDMVREWEEDVANLRGEGVVDGRGSVTDESPVTPR